MKQQSLSPDAAIEAIRRGTGKGVRIAILDSGVETRHPQLSKVNWADDVAIVEDAYRLKAIDGDGNDLFGHGTAVAGIIHRMAPEAEIGSFRVLGASIEGKTSVVARRRPAGDRARLSHPQLQPWLHDRRARAEI